MTTMARRYANIAALSDDERLARVARAQLEAAAAAETRSTMHDVAERVGSPLRDAAVDPMPEDFCPPEVVVGKDGPSLVSPEVGSVVYQERVDAVRAARGGQL